MKKIFAIFTVAAFLAVPATMPQAQARDFNVFEALVLYIPNRILDAFDMGSVAIGVGPTARIEMTGTHWFSGGAGASWWTPKLYLDYNRQWGYGLQKGYYASFICYNVEDMQVDYSNRWVKRYHYIQSGIPSPTERIYDYFTGPRDFWEIGVALGLGVEGEMYVHPIEWLDFGLGFFLIDIRSDDLTFDSFRGWWGSSDAKPTGKNAPVQEQSTVEVVEYVEEDADEPVAVEEGAMVSGPVAEPVAAEEMVSDDVEEAPVVVTEDIVEEPAGEPVAE